VAQPKAPKAPRIVAELGRPETPQETAERKAANSRAHRENQTTRNLVLALIASLAVVIVLALAVVRPDGGKPPTVNYRALASDAQSSIVGTTVASPDLPKSWSANKAQLTQGKSGEQTWSIGFLTPKDSYIGLEQGINATDAWTGGLSNDADSTGTTTIDGVDWTVYSNRTGANDNNYEYSLSATVANSRYLLHGSASAAEFRDLASAVIAQSGGN
jgi:hypothetical protein